MCLEMQEAGEGKWTLTRLPVSIYPRAALWSNLIRRDFCDWFSDVCHGPGWEQQHQGYIIAIPVGDTLSAFSHEILTIISKSWVVSLLLSLFYDWVFWAWRGWIACLRTASLWEAGSEVWTVWLPLELPVLLTTPWFISFLGNETLLGNLSWRNETSSDSRKSLFPLSRSWKEVYVLEVKSPWDSPPLSVSLEKNISAIIK